MREIIFRLFQRRWPPKPPAGPAPVISLILGDIVEQDVDAIVNAADWSLLGGTGVDGAIHAAAGPALGHACRAARRLRTSEAWASPGFQLTARHVIHTVSPVYDRSGSSIIEAANQELLEAAYRNCLSLSSRMGLASIAFPALGAGAFGWPIEDVAAAAARACAAYARYPAGLREIRFIAFDKRSFRAHEKALWVSGVIERDPASLRYHSGRSAIS